MSKISYDEDTVCRKNKTETRKLKALLLKCMTRKKESTDGDRTNEAKQERGVLTARFRRRDNWLFVANLLIWQV